VPQVLKVLPVVLTLPSLEVFQSRGGVALRDVGTVGWLGLGIPEVFSNLSDSMILKSWCKWWILLGFQAGGGIELAKHAWRMLALF